MKKNLLKKTIVCFINLLVVLMAVAPPAVSAQAASRIETPVETKSKHFSNLEGGGDLSYINLSGYSNRFGTAASGRAGTYYGPRGTYLIRDYGVNSGAGGHGGSYWKLYNRSGQRIGTYSRYGYYLRP
ncbi:hypothetical protein [Streptococcus suis]|uniref:hypothetical protein n=1 Tax=Streptococcus suis TaxID=1307 RepID=UPI000CF393C6|nr:hypothetical protein [Streptococcus suis]